MALLRRRNDATPKTKRAATPDKRRQRNIPHMGWGVSFPAWVGQKGPNLFLGLKNSDPRKNVSVLLALWKTKGTHKRLNKSKRGANSGEDMGVLSESHFLSGWATKVQTFCLPLKWSSQNVQSTGTWGVRNICCLGVLHILLVGKPPMKH